MQFEAKLRCVRLASYMNNNDAREKDILYKYTNMILGHAIKSERSLSDSYVASCGMDYYNTFLNMYEKHYDKFCIMEKIFLGRSQDDVDRLEQKVIKLENLVIELEERIACVPLGQKYDSAKKDFDSQKSDSAKKECKSQQ
jgi:hypothetical protein